MFYEWEDDEPGDWKLLYNRYKQAFIDGKVKKKKYYVRKSLQKKKTILSRLRVFLFITYHGN